jgi:galactokinase
LSAPSTPPKAFAIQLAGRRQLMYASHASLRDDYEVSCAELDAVVEIAEDIGYRVAFMAAA